MFKKLVFTLFALNILLSACHSDAETLDRLKKDEDIKETLIDNEADKKENNKDLELPKENLQKFDSGKSVKALNEFLASLGYDVDERVFNVLTTWALTDIQLQLTKDNVTGTYDELTKKKLNSLKNDKQTIIVGKDITKPKDTSRLPDIIDNPYEVLALVNKEHALPNDYLPTDLVVPDVRFPFTENVPKKQLRKVAADALEELFKASDEANLDLFAQSGFRSYERQDAIFKQNIERHGEEHANTYSARPGESEHQTGLVMDVTNQAVNFELIIEFDETKEGKWLENNAHNYGFIIRYPEDKEEITKYQYEPWHLRYVGIELANELYMNEQTLDEYYQ